MSARMQQRAATLVWCVLLVAVALAVFTSPQLASAKSSGLLGSCDLTPQFYPDRVQDGRQFWPNGRLGGNFSSPPRKVLNSGSMYWVNCPVPSYDYSIRAGDDLPSADATSYTPDVPVEIHLRVLNLQQVYIGLVVYATNNSGVKISDTVWQKETNVGDWVLTPGDPFILPDTCKNKAVTHINADIKPLHVKFFWSAPKGTGTVKFRVLIKQGEQNTGNFYWPAKELVLTEGAPRTKFPDQVTVLGEPGRACADVCKLQTPKKPYCNAYALQSQADTEVELLGWLKNSINARMPPMKACAYQGPPQISHEGYTSFRAQPGGGNFRLTCPKDYVRAYEASPPLPLPDVCYTAPLPTARAICICDGNPGAQTPNPYKTASVYSASAVEGAEDEDEEVEPLDVLLAPKSAASRSAGFLAALLVPVAAALLSSSSSSRSSVRGSSGVLALLVVALVLLVAAPAPASAHNFIKSVHRAQGASVTNPCPKRIGRQPHVQVVAGQKFEVEWSIGHGDQGFQPFYFAVVHEDDYAELSAPNITAILLDYVALAPAGANLSVDPLWNRNHIALNTECVLEGQAIDSSKDCNPVTYFNEGFGRLAPTDQRFITRETSYKMKAHPSQYNKDDSLIKQNTFRPEHLAKDLRFSYKSAKYPWLESVHRFALVFAEHATYAGQADIARFAIDARKGAGDYIVFFKWSGYGDCIDVNVQPGTALIEKRYGQIATAATPNTVVRVDHCEWTYVNVPTTRARVVSANGDVSQCMRDCNDANKNGNVGCTAIQVARVTHPPNTMFKPVNIPWHPRRRNRTLLAELGGNEALWAKADVCLQEGNTERELSGCTSDSDERVSRTGRYAINPRDDQYVCYGTIPYRNVDRQVEENYRIILDPDNPGWYSTCLIPVEAGGFINLPPYQYTPPSWQQGDRCVRCDFHASLFGTNDTFAPDWVGSLMPAGTCQNCDQMLSSQLVAQLPLVGAPQPNAGLPQVNTWMVSAPAACSCAGTAVRNVTCVDQSGKALVSGYCGGSAKPATTVACSTLPSSCFAWQQSAFAACTSDCGGGTQTASVTCVQTSASPNPGAVVADAQCSGSKPATSRACSTQACPCQWVASGFGTCSATCGSGMQTQSVKCTRVRNGMTEAAADSLCAATVGGASNTKPATSRACSTQACTGTTKLAYSAWTSCSASCGGGTQTRTKSCTLVATGVKTADSDCTGQTAEALSQACNTGVCPVYAWTQPTVWSTCTKTCGSGTQTSSVLCVNTASATPTAAVDVNYCTLSKPASMRSCNTGACPLPPNYQWVTAAWSTCSATCNGGTATRAVTCSNLAAPTVAATDANCAASTTAGAKPATSMVCAPQGCPTYSWKQGGFGACTKVCGSGTQTQTVTCVQDGTSTVVTDGLCSGAGTKPVTTRSCSTTSCADYSWKYSAWTTCSATCGSGSQSRTKQCVLTATGANALVTQCTATALPLTQACNTGACPAYWALLAWAPCSATCGVAGMQTRDVPCLPDGADPATAASLLDSACTSSKPATEQSCNTRPCASWQYDGAWSACSLACGAGVQSRKLKCAYADGSLAQSAAECSNAAVPATEQECQEMPCPHWHREQWSTCSKPCADLVTGAGTQERVIRCRMPHEEPWNGREVAPVNVTLCELGSSSGDGEGEAQVASGKPLTQQQCNIDACPAYYWKQSPMGSCSASCGGGVQSANVQCLSSATGEPANTALCVGDKPVSTVPCNTERCPQYEWAVGSESACSAFCGVGKKTRTVTCRNVRPESSIKYPFVDVAPELCASAGIMPSLEVACSSPEQQCHGSQAGVKNGRCEAGACVCRPGFGGVDCGTTLARKPVSGVTLSGTGVAQGEAGIPRGDPLSVSWTADATAAPRVSILLTRAAAKGWPVALYLASNIPNTGSWVWGGVGLDLHPALEAGAGYAIRVFAGAALASTEDSSPLFSIADGCSAMEKQCSKSGSCSNGQCVCADGFSGPLCEIGPCAAAGCHPTQSLCKDNEPLSLLKASSGGLQCQCATGFTGPQCRTPVACARTACQNGGDMSSVTEQNGMCVGTCACVGGWTGPQCSTCGLQCANGGKPKADCSSCDCPAGTSGARCERNFFSLTFRFNTDASSWLRADGSVSDEVSASRWNQTLRADLLAAVQTVGSASSAAVDITVEQIKAADAAKVTAVVSLSSSSAAAAAAATRRLLAASELSGVYTAFAPQLSDIHSQVYQGAVTSSADPTWAVQVSDPSGSQKLAQTAPPTDCFDHDCEAAEGGQPSGPGTDSEDTGSGSKSFIDTIGDSTTYTALCIIALIAIVGALVAGIVLLVRRQRNGAGQADLKRMALQDGATEMIGNPAARTSQWDRL